jgi:hypothetical protein
MGEDTLVEDCEPDAVLGDKSGRKRRGRRTLWDGPLFESGLLDRLENEGGVIRHGQGWCEGEDRSLLLPL